MIVVLGHVFDISVEQVGYKVRFHSVRKVPVIFVVGSKEKEENTVSVRRLGSNDVTSDFLNNVIKNLIHEINNKQLQVF